MLSSFTRLISSLCLSTLLLGGALWGAQLPAPAAPADEQGFFAEAILPESKNPVTIKSVRYSEAHNKRMTLCLPEVKAAHTRFDPVILLVHGGAWTTGFGSPKSFDSHCRYFAELGFATANLDYRLAPLHPYPAAPDDVESAIKWLSMKLNKSIDNNRRKGYEEHFGSHVLLVGHSAGAHLSMLVAFAKPELPIAGVVDFAGPTDLTKREACQVCEFAKVWFLRSADRHEASPVYHTRPDLPPVYIFHSKDDKVVNFQQALELKAALEKVKAPVQFYPLEGVGHWFPFEKNNHQLVAKTVIQSAMRHIVESHTPPVNSVKATPIATSPPLPVPQALTDQMPAEPY